VVRHDHAFATRHPADACDQTGPRALVVVHAVCGKGCQLKERAAWIEQTVDPIARQQLAPADVTLPGAGGSPKGGGGQLGAQLLDQRQMLLAMRYSRSHSWTRSVELMMT